MVLVLVYLLYFGIYMAGYNMLTDEISQSLYSKTSYLTNTLEEEIRRIQKLQFECINDDIIFYTISAFPILTKSEQVKKLLEMQNRLKILHESSTYIDEVFVCIPGDEPENFFGGRSGISGRKESGISEYAGKIFALPYFL